MFPGLLVFINSSHTFVFRHCIGHLILLPFSSHLSILSTQPLQICILPSICPESTYKKIGCKYFGVECQRISPAPAGRKPQSNQPCLFIQLKLFVPCFLWHASPSSLIKCHFFFSVLFAFSSPPYPPWFCLYFLEAMLDKRGSVVLCM